ncbi:MAG: hypothetical protein ACRD6Q_08540 [Nitrososphaeraceae archaeon]
MTLPNKERKKRDIKSTHLHLRVSDAFKHAIRERTREIGLDDLSTYAIAMMYKGDPLLLHRRNEKIKAAKNTDGKKTWS